MTCTRKITPADAARLDQILAELPEHAVLCLEEGTYPAQLHVGRSLTIRGEGNVIIDARAHAPALTVMQPGIDVTVEHLTLRRGAGGALGAGGNVELAVEATLTLRDVRLEAGSSESNGGGGFRAHAGRLVFERCRFERNSGRRAATGLGDGSAQIVLRDSYVAPSSEKKPALVADYGTDLQLDHSTISGTLRVSGISVRAPRVSIDHSIVGELTVDAPGPAPQIAISHSALPQLISGVQDGGGNHVGALELDGDGRPVKGPPDLGPR